MISPQRHREHGEKIKRLCDFSGSVVWYDMCEWGEV